MSLDTGEPSEVRNVTCDAAERGFHLGSNDLLGPTEKPVFSAQFFRQPESPSKYIRSHEAADSPVPNRKEEATSNPAISGRR